MQQLSRDKLARTSWAAVRAGASAAGAMPGEGM